MEEEKTELSWRARKIIGGRERLAQFRIRYVDDVLSCAILTHEIGDLETGESLTHLVPANSPDLTGEFRWRRAMTARA
jgi:hypothetical protein